VEISEDYLGGKSGSISAVDVGDGARYWRLIEAGLRVLKEIKIPCQHSGFWG
jgi:hypothetical protein